MKGNSFDPYKRSNLTKSRISYLYGVVYKASLDWSAKLVTAFVTVLFVSILVSFPMSISFGFTFVLLTTIYVFCYLYRPLEYVVGADKIIIKRPFRDKEIAITTIKDVYAIKKNSMGWMMKTFGNGGLFGFYGEFRSGRYGQMTWYATRRSNYVMLETTEHEKIVLTPDDPDMVKEIKNLIGK